MQCRRSSVAIVGSYLTTYRNISSIRWQQSVHDMNMRNPLQNFKQWQRISGWKASVDQDTFLQSGI
eukprot:3889476-Amphidinium_carterae.1